MKRKILISVIFSAFLSIGFVIGAFIYPQNFEAKKSNDQFNLDFGINEKRYQFIYPDSSGELRQYIDDSKFCFNNEPSTKLVDVDGDGAEEIIVSCYGGGTSNSIQLSVFQLLNERLDIIGEISSESYYQLYDCNNDEIVDIISYFKDIPAGDDGFASWKKSIYCNSWNDQSKEFVETKIGEEQ